MAECSLEESLNRIAEAILGLYSDPIKDYILPSITSLASAAFGAWAAFYAVNVQERNRIHIQNVDSINEAILCANNARNTLISIKSNYAGQLTSNPHQRLLTVTRMLKNGEPITFQISKLIFIAPSDPTKIYSKWQKVAYIESLFSNYNHVLDIWTKRNETLDKIIPKLTQYHGQSISLNELHKNIEPGQLAILSDLTEHALMMTDDILIELSCLIIGFPEVGKKSIPKKVINKYRKIISILLPNNEMAVDLLSLTPDLDNEAAAKLHNSTASEVKERYRRLYP